MGSLQANAVPTSGDLFAGAAARRGRIVERLFTDPGCSAYDLFQWDHRSCTLTNDSGEVLFDQTDVECPSQWSQMAALVVASKYLYGQPGTPQREDGVRSMVHRVVDTISEWGDRDGYFSDVASLEAFREELAYVVLDQRAAFNSPVWFNVGVRERPQCSACFIISVDDELDSLTELQRLEAKLFKFGSGTGTNFSRIRSRQERLSGGGTASGPLSFMRALDAWAGIIKSGGKTRRAAKMMMLNVDHPDILDFIKAKSEEERKAHVLIDGGYDGSFAARGGAYDSVGLQNANLSVRVSNEFMEAAVQNAPFRTKFVATGKPAQEFNARDVLHAIAEGTHFCGDPGLQFDTTINDWHTCPRSGRINGSNPCSEYMSIDNSACNLSSINLLKYLRADGTFDCHAFSHTVDLLMTAQDILIENSSYPTQKIAGTARDFRQLGLGYSNLGAVLMSLGLPYDSVEGRSFAAAATALMTGQAYKTSAGLARDLAPFRAFRRNKKPMLEVIRKHKEQLHTLPSGNFEELRAAAKARWSEAEALGERHGFRNAQATVLAPTGTISFMMDCDTTGIEPELALVKYKKLSGGGMLKIVNQSVRRALGSLGYTADAISTIEKHIEEQGTIEGADDLKPEHLSIFDCALKPGNGRRCIGYRGHLAMMAAAQPFLSGAISKTVNLPVETTVAEISDVYIDAWRMGLKSVALYRDGSKRTQPLNTKKSPAETVPGTGIQIPARRALPNERAAITHRFKVGGLKGYLTVGLFDDGKPGEIFLVVAKEGSTLSGVMDAFATATSLALQYGVPLLALAKKFTHVRFEPSGFTDNRDIPIAKSIIDYVFRWLGRKFLTADEQNSLGLLKETSGAADTKNETISRAAVSAGGFTDDAPPCTACGSSLMLRSGACYVCVNCGTQGGCG